MNLSSSLRVIRERWLLVTLVTLIALGAAGAYGYTASPQYAARTQLFVATAGESDVAQAYQGGLFSQQRVKSYSDVVTSPLVLSGVIAQLGLTETPDQLQSHITATAPLDTVLINVEVRDTDPGRARDIANALGDEFGSAVSRIETPAGQSKSPVKVSVVRPATTPIAPVSPRPKLDLVIGLLAGLLLGCAGALALDGLDTRIKTSSDVEENGLTALGAIARDPNAAERPLFLHDDHWSPRAESYRQLRTNIRFAEVNGDLRSFVVTSSLPGDGKTTTAANLAVALAQSGKRVVLVDADLRRPRVTELMGANPAQGLTNVLVGELEPAAALQEWRADLPLQVLASGPVPPNPSELLGSQRMASLLHELRAHADVVILDTPPLLPVTDAAVLASQTDGAIVVVRSNKTRRDQMQQAVKSLHSAGASVLGCVLNAVPRSSRYGGYTGGYSYEPTRRPLEATPDLPAAEPAEELAA